MRFSTADSAARRGAAVRARPDSVNDQPPETPKYGWALFRTPLTHFEQQEKIKERSAGASLYHEWARRRGCGSRDHARLLPPVDFGFVFLFFLEGGATVELHVCEEERALMPLLKTRARRARSGGVVREGATK